MPNSIAATEVWSKALLERIAPINVALNFADVPPESDEIYEQGDRVNCVTPGSVSTGTYTKGTDITPGTISDTEEYLAISDTLYWAFDVDHIDRVQANPQLVARYMKEAGNAISRGVDTYLFAAHTQAASANKITGASNAALALSTNDPYDLIVDASVKLSSLDVPLTDRWIVINPYTHGILLKDKDHFVRASALGDLVVTTARFEGATARTAPAFVGQIGGMDVYLSSNLPTASNKTYLIYGQGKPISYISQLNQVEAVPLARQFGVSLKQLILHGKKVFTENTKRLGSIYIENA